MGINIQYNYLHETDGLIRMDIEGADGFIVAKIVILIQLKLSTTLYLHPTKVRDIADNLFKPCWMNAYLVELQQLKSSKIRILVGGRKLKVLEMAT
ncbi:MAG: hypothetical protein KME26_18160 [Oscillatoria princeps RMCB-10]|nr:hypothetical protein [Oscillatoria princeps RMCB-10]